MEKARTVVRRLVVVGILLIVVGLVLGLRTISVDGKDCGAAFMANPTADYAFDTDACDDARASAKPLPIVVLVLGGLVLAGAWVTAGVTGQSPRGQGPGQMPVERYFLGRKLGRQDEPK